MVRGPEDVLYARLAERYNAVVQAESNLGDFTAPLLPVEPAVRTQRDIDDSVFVLEWLGDYKSGDLEDIVSGQGTAFVYKKLNLLVTCEHVLWAEVKINSFKADVSYDDPDVKNVSFNLVQPKTRQSWPAKVLFRDRQLDIALIAFDVEEPPPHRFFRSTDSPIQTGSNGYLIGYPNYQPGKLPNILRDQVLNRTMPNKGMDSFTVANAGSIRPGNSGGPFTDESFHVAGVAQRGAFHGTGDDECLCYTIVDKIIERWQTSLQKTAQQHGLP
jgi:S1-C subfamily serine protease